MHILRHIFVKLVGLDTPGNWYSPLPQTKQSKEPGGDVTNEVKQPGK